MNRGGRPPRPLGRLGGGLAAREEPLLQSCVRSALGSRALGLPWHQEALPEGGSGLSGQPVRQVFRLLSLCVGKPGVSTPRPRRGGGLASPHSRGPKPGQPLWRWRRPGLRGGHEKVGKKEQHVEMWGWCITYLEILAENQVLRGSKSRRGAPTGPGRASGRRGGPGPYVLSGRRV